VRGRHRRSRLRWTDFVIFPALALVVYLGLPAQWGGTNSYIVIRGDSMLPTYETGDLVVVRPADSYHQGDVVAYRVPDGDFGEGTIVIHRVVSAAAEHLILQGDNNPDLDTWEPTEADVVGLAVFSVPNAGGLLA